MRNQIGGRVEQRIKRQKTRAQGVLANRCAVVDAEHLCHHHGLIGFAGVDAAADDARGMGVV